MMQCIPAATPVYNTYTIINQLALNYEIQQ